MLREKSSLGEGDLDQDDAEREQGEEGVDGAARAVDPALLSVAAEQRRDGCADRGEEGQRQGGAAEASRHSRRSSRW